MSRLKGKQISTCQKSPLKWKFPLLIYSDDHTNNISYFYGSGSERHHSFLPYGKDDAKYYLAQEEKVICNRSEYKEKELHCNDLFRATSPRSSEPLGTSLAQASPARDTKVVPHLSVPTTTFRAAWPDPAKGSVSPHTEGGIVKRLCFHGPNR